MSLESYEAKKFDPKAELKELKASMEVAEMVTERICKDGIRKALQTVNSIDQIPKWGKEIIYYRQEGKLKGQKLSKDSMKALHLPETFDISPRVIKDPVVSMVFHLWGRKFDIEPDVGQIKSIKLTTTALELQVGKRGVDITKVYDKQTKLPDFFWRMRTVKPDENKVIHGFRGVTVKEV